MHDLDAHCERDPVMGCLLWTRAVNSKGAPVAVIDGRTRLVARVLYEKVRGPLPSGVVLALNCGIKRCVEPSHREPMAAAVLARRPRRRRSASGSAPAGSDAAS